MTGLGGALRVRDMYLALKPLAEAGLWIAVSLLRQRLFDRGLLSALTSHPQEEVLSQFLVMERQESGPALRTGCEALREKAQVSCIACRERCKAGSQSRRVDLKEQASALGLVKGCRQGLKCTLFLLLCARPQGGGEVRQGESSKKARKRKTACCRRKCSIVYRCREEPREKRG